MAETIKEMFKETDKQADKISKPIEKVDRGFQRAFLDKGRNPFQRQATPPEYSKEQKILFEMFGGGDKVMTNFDGRSLPRINKTLISGGGLLKSGDYERETAALFGRRR